MRLLYIFILSYCFYSCNDRLGSQKPLDTNTAEVQELSHLEQEKLNNPSNEYAHLPRLKAQEGKLYMTWIEQKDSLAILKYAEYASAKWSPAKSIASGTDWFVNWADFPAIAINKGTVMATFLQKSATGTYDYDVKYTLRDKETQTWSIPKTLHNDQIAAEHGFTSLLPYKEGFFATWLDGRKTKPSESEDGHSHGGSGAMTLRSALIDTNGIVTQRTELDNKVCDCCNTSAVQTDKGIVIVYRDRSEGIEEVRDIYRMIWQEDKTVVASPVHNDNWLISGCPVNGPSIDAFENAAVASWFTAADDIPAVKVAFSQDGGLNFENAIRLDAGEAIGRVDVAMVNETCAYAIWMEPQGDEVILQLKKVYSDGSQDQALNIAKMSGERMSGFPQLEIIGDTGYIAWTSLTDKKPSIEMITFSLE